MFRAKEMVPILIVSMKVSTITAAISFLYASVFLLILGWINPKWSIVVRLPEKMPLMSPLTVSIGGKRARIHEAVLNQGENNEIRLPANRLPMLKDSAMRV